MKILLNPDAKVVKTIKDGLAKKDGYCPKNGGKGGPVFRRAGARKGLIYRGRDGILKNSLRIKNEGKAKRKGRDSHE